MTQESPCADEERRGLKADREGRKLRALHVFEVQDQPFVYMRDPEMYIYDIHRKDLFYSSVAEFDIHFLAERSDDEQRAGGGEPQRQRGDSVSPSEQSERDDVCYLGAE